ncbi:MAG: glycosyltransferase [Dehalococcoidia bacterium]|nr:glycosyltransferase [Dehalococcoidia bacterium]
MSFEATFAILAAVPIYMIAWGYLMFAASLFARVPREREDTSPYFFVLVIPALNEELVIGNTIRRLLTLPGDNYLLFVVDDGSDDDTASVVERFNSDKVRLSTRKAPVARKGKGAVLNHAYHAILTSELPEIYGLDNIVVVVMDADCEVEPNFLTAVAPYFDRSETAGVQVGVRMMNQKDNLVTLWQQLEFTTFNWVFSQAHEALGSASLGGNGQFVRLSALTSLGGLPWTACLTEDLDVGLRLATRGWTNHYCNTTKVHQQAVSSVRRLLRQRSRWYHGHLSCWRHIPAVLGARMPFLRKLDILNYLLAPALVVPLGLFSIFAFTAFMLGVLAPVAPDWMPRPVADPSRWMAWYVLGLGTVPLAAWALIKDGQARLPRALLLSHFYVAGGYIWMAAAFMAGWRLLQRSGGWLKTARTPIPGDEVAVLERADAEPDRYLATRTTVYWLQESRQLLPLRADNFLPRHTRREHVTTAVNYEAASIRPSRVTGELLMARGQAHLGRLRQTLAAIKEVPSGRSRRDDSEVLVDVSTVKKRELAVR